MTASGSMPTSNAISRRNQSGTNSAYSSSTKWVSTTLRMFFEDVTLPDGSVVKRFAPVESGASAPEFVMADLPQV